MKNSNLVESQKALLSVSKDNQTSLPKLSKPENMTEYTRLVKGIHREAMNTAYPITQTKIDEELWEQWITQFLHHHPSKTKEIWKLPFEFYHYLKEHQDVNKQAVYLEDLMLFEWMEIEAFNVEDVSMPSFKKELALDAKLLVNPYVFLEQLTYPVFRNVSEQEWIDGAGTYYLMCYRKESDLRAYYSQLHPTAILILDKLGDGMTPHEILKENQIPISLSDLEELLHHFLEKEIVLGTLS